MTNNLSEKKTFIMEKMSNDKKSVIEKLLASEILTESEWMVLLNSNWNKEETEELHAIARTLREENYGRKVFIRGLLEFTNVCRNDCYYCGLRKSNSKVNRFRLTKDELLYCAGKAYDLGFRTFVMQGGEDPYFTADALAEIISQMKARYPDCAVTLSFGEHPKEYYKKWKDAGANRYLLRHESVDPVCYSRLHPKEMLLENRLRCLNDLRELGYQTGAGFMIGPPYQTMETIAKDLSFLQKFRPEMVGIGPFIPHEDTPFGIYPPGSTELTLRIYSLVRISQPEVLLPATTALSTLDKNGQVLGMNAGCNVVMPNISPAHAKKNYMLYNGKAVTGDDDGARLAHLRDTMAQAGYQVSVDRGDHVTFRGLK